MSENMKRFKIAATAFFLLFAGVYIYWTLGFHIPLLVRTEGVSHVDITFDGMIADITTNGVVIQPTPSYSLVITNRQFVSALVTGIARARRTEDYRLMVDVSLRLVYADGSSRQFELLPSENTDTYLLRAPLGIYQFDRRVLFDALADAGADTNRFTLDSLLYRATNQH